MYIDPVKNFAKAIVNTTYDASATSIVLTSGHGARFPAPTTDGAFNVVWWDSTTYPDPTDDPNAEIVRVTARSTDTLTVTRAQEGTSASTKNTAGKVYKMMLAVTKKMIDSIRESSPVGHLILWPTGSAPTGFLLCDGSAVSRTTYADLYNVIGTTFGIGDGSTTFNLPDFRGRMAVGVGQGTQSINFATGDVNATTDVITVPSNSTLFDGTPVVLTTTGTLPAGLSLATTYYVVRLSATTIKLSTDQNGARGLGTTGSGTASSIVNITDAGSGTHTITVTLESTRALAEKGGEETRKQSVMEMPNHDHTTTAELETGSSGSGGTGGGQTPQGDIGTTGGSTPFNVMSPFLVINYAIKY